MKTNFFGMDLGMLNANPMLAWWQQQWLKSVQPLANLQLAWMESLVEATKFEAEFLKMVAESGEQLANCIDGEAPASAEDVQACYRQLFEQISEAQRKRMERTIQLSHDFRKQVWEKI